MTVVEVATITRKDGSETTLSPMARLYYLRWLCGVLRGMAA